MEINDILLYIVLGLSILVFVFIMLSEIKNTVRDSGVDDVLDELFQTVKSQPKPYHDEERQEDFKRKYPQEE